MHSTVAASIVLLAMTNLHMKAMDIRIIIIHLHNYLI